MSTALICSALEIPLDRWPPDHYALLGLPVGDVAGTILEERVLERMERLRRYQLADPEAVTEAMNRLAQALVCLSDPAAKAEYDAGLRSPLSHDPPGIRKQKADEVEPQSYGLAAAEPIAVGPVGVGPRTIRPAYFDDDPRRRLYRKLAARRRLLATWRNVGNHLSPPNRTMTPSEAIEFVALLLDLRGSLSNEAALDLATSGHPGALVTALARQHLPLTTYRHLRPEQREALAADWRAAERQLDDEYEGLRRAVRRRSWQAPARLFRKFVRAVLTDRLDLTLFLLGLAALGLAVWRAM